MGSGGNEAAKWRRHAKVAEVFTPGAPINQLSLFAGRLDQVIDVMNAVGQRGQHVILYGERGVGKTSLANVLADIFHDRKMTTPRSVSVNCNTNDDFPSIWRKLLRNLDLEDGEADPEDVRYALEKLERRTLIVIDELDRLENDEALTLLADTVKTLSDHSVPATLVLVGVANSVDDLIGDHRSIERALTQVQMPRMSEAELTEIIDKGLDALGMKIDRKARRRIAKLSEGLPYYTHLLGLYAAHSAVGDDRSDIRPADIDLAISQAVQKAQHTIRSSYQKATRSPRPDSRFEEVLLACALAPKDELGYFTASGVRDPMSRIMGKRYEIPAFARHLNEFADFARGPVLQKDGRPRRYFYGFENPLLQPFVILNGLAKNRITESVVNELQGQAGAIGLIHGNEA
jgi:Cdc6-like AAA superfamily ATPase